METASTDSLQRKLALSLRINFKYSFWTFSVPPLYRSSLEQLEAMDEGTGWSLTCQFYLSLNGYSDNLSTLSQLQRISYYTIGTVWHLPLTFTHVKKFLV